MLIDGMFLKINAGIVEANIDKNTPTKISIQYTVGKMESVK